LRKNHARIRYWLWLMASVKFPFPFSLLAGVGSHIAWRRGSATANTGVYIAMDQLGRRFSQSRMSPVSDATPAMHSFGLIDLLPALPGGDVALGCRSRVVRAMAANFRGHAESNAVMPLREGREVETLYRLQRAAGMSKQIEIRAIWLDTRGPICRI
jgi:bla regulator protein blaR1